MPSQENAATEGRLLQELAVEEAALLQAEEGLRMARHEYEVAARKYAAVRDLVTDALGYSPYHEDAEWTSSAAQIIPKERRGAHRFLHLKPRDAIIAALSEGPSELTLESLNERLQSGGLDLGMRSINAALMRLAGVLKGPRGAYRLAENGRQKHAA